MAYTTISKTPLGLWGILLFLWRLYVLPTFSLCPSFLFTSPLSRLPPSFTLRLPPSLALTSYTALTSTYPPPSPANLLRALLRNNHPLPRRLPLSTHSSPIICSNADLGGCSCPCLIPLWGSLCCDQCQYVSGLVFLFAFTLCFA